MTDLKTRIENIYALDRERTQGEWGWYGSPKDVYIQIIALNTNYGTPIIAKVSKGTGSEADAAFIKQAPEMVDIIRSLEAKVESLTLEIKELKSCN